MAGWSRLGTIGIIILGALATTKPVLLAVVLAHWALPRHVDVGLDPALDRTGMNAPPKLVGGTLGNDSDLQSPNGPAVSGLVHASHTSVTAPSQVSSAGAGDRLPARIEPLPG